MDGHARTAGRLFQTLKVSGKKYTLRAPPVGTLIADMEAYIVSLRENPFVLAADAVEKLPESLPADRRAALEERIWKAAEAASIRSGAASAAEMNEFTNSLRGIAYQLWTCLQEEQGDEIQSVGDALGLIERFVEEAGESGLTELRAKVLSATGEADAKNSSGPNRKRSGKRKGNKDRKSGAGRKSTSTSRPSTTSTRSK